MHASAYVKIAGSSMPRDAALAARGAGLRSSIDCRLRAFLSGFAQLMAFLSDAG